MTRSTTPREYRGCLIHRNSEPHKLRWWSFGPNGRQLAADTLDGMRQLIRAELGQS